MNLDPWYRSVFCWHNSLNTFIKIAAFKAKQGDLEMLSKLCVSIKQKSPLSRFRDLIKALMGVIKNVRCIVEPICLRWIWQIRVKVFNQVETNLSEWSHTEVLHEVNFLDYSCINSESVNCLRFCKLKPSCTKWRPLCYKFVVRKVLQNNLSKIYFLNCHKWMRKITLEIDSILNCCFVIIQAWIVLIWVGKIIKILLRLS